MAVVAAPPKDAFMSAVESGTSGFRTNAAKVKAFGWTTPSMSLQASADMAFPGGAGWTDIAFDEAAGRTWTLPAVVEWVSQELFGGPDPFAEHGGAVPVPYTALDAQGGKFSTPRDQLEPGQYVTYSRRQVCYIVAKSLIGSKTAGYGNGLERFLHKDVYGKCTAAGSDFGRAFWSLLAACAADPTLAAGAHGPVLLAAKGEEPPAMADVRSLADSAPLAGAGLRTCLYDDGTDPTGLAVARVPEAACRGPPQSDRPGADFMTGGIKGQAVQDISAMFLGGYVYGNTCNLGGGQDERLMVYYPEVTALAFFLSEAGPDGVYGPPQLRQPAWILGARRVRVGVDGTALRELLFEPDPKVPLTSDLVDIQVAGAGFSISMSKPFLAFMSENQGFLGWPEPAASLKLARANREPKQREVDPSSKYAFEKQVRAWYRAVSLTSYAKEVQPALRRVVTSIGVGPWGAGLWWGDSQISWLASWIGHAAAARTWGRDLPLDYYLYSAFTENPGNQCLLHSAARCKQCAARCVATSAGEQHAFWLPGEAFMTVGDPNPCAVTGDACGQAGFEDIMAAWGATNAGALWRAVEATLQDASAVPAQSSVFDLLMQHAVTV